MIETIIDAQIDLWPLIVFSGVSGSGKTEFKVLLEGELNRIFDSTGIKAKSSVFSWYSTRDKRENETIDHIFVEGDTRVERESILNSLDLDYVIRHPDNEEGNLYGWSKEDIIAALRRGPVAFSIPPEHTESVISKLETFVPHIATIGIVSDRAKQNVDARRDSRRVNYFDEELMWFMKYFDIYNYVIENHGFDERLMQFDPDEFYKDFRKYVMRATEITLYTVFRAIRGEESRALGSREFSKRLNDEYLENRLMIIENGKLKPSKSLKDRFLQSNHKIGVQTFDRTIQAGVENRDGVIFVKPVAGSPRNENNVKVPLSLLDFHFGSSGTYGLDDRQETLRVEVLKPKGSLDEFGELVRPEIEKLWEKYVKPVDGKRNETPVSENDLEMIVSLTEKIVMMQIERKVKPAFLFGQDDRRIRNGWFPFTVDLNEEGYSFHRPNFAVSGVGINFLYQCFLLTGDRAYLDEANEGIGHIDRARKDISKFNLTFILGELVDFSSNSEGKVAEKFIKENIKLVLESYDDKLGIFQNSVGSDVINAYSYKLPKLINFAISKGFIDNGWKDKLNRHVDNYKRILIREDGSVAEQAEYLDGEWVHRSTLGYDKDNNRVSHFLRLQTMTLDMMLEYGDIQVAKKIAEYIENCITNDFKIPVDEKYPKQGNWQDNAATVNAVRQYQRVYQKTGDLKYKIISYKLLLGILYEAVDFDEHRDGLIKGVFYKIKEMKGTNCSFIFADTTALETLNKLKNKMIT